MRHTFAAWAIASVSLAKQIGTSLQQIEETYAHLLPNAADAIRTALEGFMARDLDADATFGH